MTIPGLRRTRGLPLALLLVGGFACSDAVAPPSGTPYEWRLVVGIDSLSFHWPRAGVPVKIWVEGSLGMPAHVTEAIRQWRPAFPSGEWNGQLTTDSLVADIIVRAVSPPMPAPSPLRLGGSFLSCEGATDIDTVATRFELRLPVHAWVYPLDPAALDLAQCLQAVATHELGHTLGIFQHSPDAADLMYTFPAVNFPSGNDLATAYALYHTPSDMVPVRP